MRVGVLALREITRPQAELLVSAAVAAVRLELPWAECFRVAEREPEWLLLDHYLSAPRDAGLPVEARVGYGLRHLMPGWLDAAGGADASDYIQHFATLVGSMAPRCGAVQRFQLEHELNLAGHWERRVRKRRRGTRWADPGFHRALLDAGLSALRAARPEAESLISVSTAGPGWRGWLSEVVGGLAVTPSCIGVSVWPCAFLPDPSLASRVGDVVREVQDLTGLPVEVAATGYPTHHRLWTQAQQRRYLVEVVREAREAGAVRLTLATLRDQPYPDPVLGYWSPRPPRHLGLLRQDGGHKSALSELRVAITGVR